MILRTQLMTLNVESKIQSQPRVASEIGAAQGIRMRKRTSDLPRKSFMRARARMLPSTMTVICVTNVKTNVFVSDRWNTRFLMTLRKFSKPTKEKLRLPADEFVKLRATARTKGRATSKTI